MARQAALGGFWNRQLMSWWFWNQCIYVRLSLLTALLMLL